MQLFPWKGLVNLNAPGTVCFIPVVLSLGMLQGFSQEVWERLWLRKEQREWGHQCRSVFALQPSLCRATANKLFCTKQSKLGKRLNFWESGWGRVGLGPGDGMSVLSGIPQ